MKYYATNYRGVVPESLLKKWGWSLGRGQFPIVVKARSFAEANRKTEAWFGRKLFIKDFTSQTGNVTAIQRCDELEAIIGEDNYHNPNYQSLIELSEALKEEEDS